MKMNKKLTAFLMALIVFINCVAFGVVPIFAHDVMLSVTYDDCSEAGLDRDDPNVTYVPEDGINETWYSLIRDSVCRHIGNETNTIKYYFEEIPNDSVIWDMGFTEADMEEIKIAYANSMKKWNNVYYYSYNSDGTIIKNKIIEVSEGDSSAQGHNLTISFYYTDSEGHNIASTKPTGGTDHIENGDVEHYHYSEWEMSVNVHCFKYGGSHSSSYVDVIKERNGAHEFGHVLGLRDVDKICDGDAHHEEILMGYGAPMSARSSDIKYKDIAGVAIMRGFHTDNDHKWLNCGQQSDGTYKLICSICNGVKYVDSLSGYTYETYGSCNQNHFVPNGNMMAVASYGNKDYYKCKYCRYVAPFNFIMSQNYSAEPVDGGTYHRCTNNAPGLNYSFLEEHEFVNGACATCGYEHPHTWANGVCTGCEHEHPHTYMYLYKTNSYHMTTCICGIRKTDPHFVRSSDAVGKRYVTCLGCNREIDLNNNIVDVLPTSITQVSINGSYILPNGIVVLADEDIEAYLNGTLQFYDADKIPETE